MHSHEGHPAISKVILTLTLIKLFIYECWWNIGCLLVNQYISLALTAQIKDKSVSMGKVFSQRVRVLNN
jgi:hypothetical protein